MTGYGYHTEKLGKHHNRKDFRCGVEVLDRYLERFAFQDLRRNVTIPYVLVDSTAELLVGYYTLSSSSMLPGSLPSEVLKKLPRYDTFPAVLLGRLAVDLRYRGQGMGALLLQDAVQRCLEHGEGIAVMAVVVEAKDDDARRFYEHFGFRRYQDAPNHLYLPTTEIPRL